MNVCASPRRFRLGTLLFCAALFFLAASPANAGTQQLKPLEVGAVTIGTATLRGHETSSSRTFLRSSRASWWGGTYYTSAGEPVRVNFSDLYASDPATAQSFVNFLGQLTHGPEISRVTLWIAPWPLVQLLCGSAAALGCYSPGSQFLAVIGNDVPGYTVEQVLMHEFGHHIANNRSNPPWLAGTWGTKRWASYQDVCNRAQSGIAFPGDEGAHYLQNPGEAFAESYMFLNAQRFGVALPPWTFDPMFSPDSGALSTILDDVMSPYTGPKAFVWKGKLAKRGATKAATLPTPLDGDASFQVVAPRGSVFQIYENGTLVHSAGTDTSGRICGVRELKTRVIGGTKGNFRVTATIP
jgi:hypothetical protein